MAQIAVKTYSYGNGYLLADENDVKRGEYFTLKATKKNLIKNFWGFFQNDIDATKTNVIIALRSYNTDDIIETIKAIRIS